MSRTVREIWPIGPNANVALIDSSLLVRRALRAGARNHLRNALRSSSPSLAIALATWNFTASRLMPRRRAISRLLMPCWTACTTRHSAGVSTSAYGGRPRFDRIVMAPHDTAGRWRISLPPPGRLQTDRQETIALHGVPARREPVQQQQDAGEVRRPEPDRGDVVEVERHGREAP